jgi:hypothetical protein
VDENQQMIKSNSSSKEYDIIMNPKRHAKWYTSLTRAYGDLIQRGKIALAAEKALTCMGKKDEYFGENAARSSLMNRSLRRLIFSWIKTNGGKWKVKNISKEDQEFNCQYYMVIKNLFVAFLFREPVKPQVFIYTLLEMLNLTILTAGNDPKDWCEALKKAEIIFYFQIPGLCKYLDKIANKAAGQRKDLNVWFYELSGNIAHFKGEFEKAYFPLDCLQK